MQPNFIFEQETYNIIGCCYEVHKNLGPGFHESVYQEALEIEFLSEGIPYEREMLLNVFYKGQKLNKTYVADFVCYEKIILELKAVDSIHPEYISQVINYLKATKHQLGLIVNFGSKRLQQKRVIY